MAYQLKGKTPIAYHLLLAEFHRNLSQATQRTQTDNGEEAHKTEN